MSAPMEINPIPAGDEASPETMSEVPLNDPPQTEMPSDGQEVVLEPGTSAVVSSPVNNNNSNVKK